jgi:hypothetical protein
MASSAAMKAVRDAVAASQDDKYEAWMSALEVVRARSLEACRAAAEQQARDDVAEAVYQSEKQVPSERKRLWIRAFDSTAEAWLYQINPTTSGDYKQVVQRIKRPAVWSTRDEGASTKNAQIIADALDEATSKLDEVCDSIGLISGAIEAAKKQ